MKTVYIIISILLTIVVIFFISNRIYRHYTIDKGLGREILKGAIILDVRTDKEYKNGHIDGSINISLGKIKERYIELDSSKTYITYCSHGIRSVEVKNILKDNGFQKVFNGGGMSDLEVVIEKNGLKK